MISKKLITTFSLFFLSIVFSTSQAAPIPATSSSSVISPEKRIYRSEVGFQINAEKTQWQLTPPPKDSKYILTSYRSPKLYKNTQASLTVRLDKLRKKQSLKSYVKKWLKQYPKFGFTILGNRSFKNHGKKGYVLDLLNKESQKQLRQVVFLKKNAAIVMTCRDHVENFKSSLKNCNKIIKSFKWTKPVL